MNIFIYLQTFSAVVALIYGYRILNWVWFRPRYLEKCLRKQGFSGNSYRLLYGDSKDIRAMAKEVLSKPMISLCHDYVHRVNPIIHTALKKFGENCFIWFGPTPAITIMDPKNIREVVSKSYVFHKPPGRPFIRLVSRGLVTLETEKWAKHRRLISPAFQDHKLKNMVPSFYLSCDDMRREWDEILAKKGGGSSEVDVWPFLQTLTRDVISRTAFGSSYMEGRRIFELQNELAQQVMVATRSVSIPGYRFLPTEGNRRVKEIAKEIQSSLLGIINRRVQFIEEGEEASGDDLLGLLLESNSKEIKQNGNKSGMSMNEVIEECKLFYFAGNETTSSLLVWTMILLSKHSDWQARARDEVLQVLGKGNPNYQDLNRLKIVTMILQEVLRLYPPAISLTRFTHEECRLGDLDLPAGVQLILPVYFLHHDRGIWGEDAEEFRPERFSDGVPKAAQAQMAYFPFGWGPRICIAQNFAMTEAKMAVAVILQNYSFQLSPSYAHAPHQVVALQPQYGAHLILSKL